MATSHSDHHDQQAAPLAIPAIDVSPVRAAALTALVIGAIAFIVLAYLNISTSDGYGLRDIFSAYTVGFVFWASLPFGALSMTLIAFMTSASWGIVLRRCFHAATRTMPVVAVLFIPVAVSVFVVELQTGMRSVEERERIPFVELNFLEFVNLGRRRCGSRIA